MWLIVLALLFIINSIFTVKIEKYIKSNYKQRKPLLDIGHKLLPNTYKYRIINDIIPLILVVLTMINIENRKAYVKAIVTCVVLRMICIYCTVLPPTHKKCDYDGTYVGGCYDKLFSGHMTLCVISSLFLSSVFPQFSHVLLLLNMCEAFNLIASRDHYTVDVVLGIIISYSMTFIHNRG